MGSEADGVAKAGDDLKLKYRVMRAGKRSYDGVSGEASTLFLRDTWKYFLVFGYFNSSETAKSIIFARVPSSVKVLPGIWRG